MTEQQIWKIITTKTDAELKQWMSNLSDDDAIEASRMIAELAKRIPQYQEDTNFQNQVNDALSKADEFEEKVIDEKVQHLLHDVEMDAAFRQLDDTLGKMRYELKTALLKQPADANLLKLVTEFRQIEIDSDCYDEINWLDVNHLL